MEAIARVTILTQDIFPEMAKRSYWRTLMFVPPSEGLDFAFYGTAVLGDGATVSVVGFIEPYLQESEVQSILDAIQRGIDWLKDGNLVTFPYVVQIIDKVEGPDALTKLCSNLPDEDIPVVVMYEDGTIICFANTDDTGALFICALMGRPNCNYNPDYPLPVNFTEEENAETSSYSSSMYVGGNTNPRATCNKIVACLRE